MTHARRKTRDECFRLIVALMPVVLSACGNGAVRGRALYAQHGCAVCHGSSARGDGPSVARLDVPPRDLTDRRAYRNGADVERIAASIRSGAGAMPAYRDLTEEEARDIAAWLVSQQQEK